MSLSFNGSRVEPLPNPPARVAHEAAPGPGVAVAASAAPLNGPRFTCAAKRSEAASGASAGWAGCWCTHKVRLETTFAGIVSSDAQPNSSLGSRSTYYTIFTRLSQKPRLLLRLPGAAIEIIYHDPAAGRPPTRTSLSRRWTAGRRPSQVRFQPPGEQLQPPKADALDR